MHRSAELVEHDGRLYRSNDLFAQLPAIGRQIVEDTAPRTLQAAWDGGQLLFHLVSPLYEQTSVIVTTNLACGECPPLPFH